MCYSSLSSLPPIINQLYMNFYCAFLLLLVVLSAYSESPQYANPPPIEITIYPNSNSAHLGILALVLPQNEVLKSVTVNYQLSCNLKIIVDFVLNVQVKSF